MAQIEATLHLGAAGVMPRVRVHRDGRSCELRCESQGSAFVVHGDPLLLRRWLVLALGELEHEVATVHG